MSESVDQEKVKRRENYTARIQNKNERKMAVQEGANIQNAG